MAFIDTLKSLFGSAWHVNSDNILSGMLPATDGALEASKLVTTDANKAINGLGGALVSGAGAIGYSTGAGGAVTQITNSATGVTLNKATGQITTVALTTAAGAEEVFTVTDSAVLATDVPVVSTTYAGAGTILVSTKNVVAGAFDVVITNLHASVALNAAAVINFALIKGVAA